MPGEWGIQHPTSSWASYLAGVDAPGQITRAKHGAGVQPGPQGPPAGVHAEQGHVGLPDRLCLRPIYREAVQGAQAWGARAPL